MAPLLFLICIVLLCVGTVSPYIVAWLQGTLLPDLISAHGRHIDHEIKTTLVVTGFFFLAAHAVLAWFILKYRDRGQAARPVSGRRAVALVATIPIAFVILEVVVNIMSQGVWAELRMNDGPPDALQVEVNGLQFKWYFRYAGNDGVLGMRAPELVDDSSQNFLGVDYEGDKFAKDDLVQGALRVPWNRPVLYRIRSRDVLHSFFVRELRVKQDAVPGLEIKMPVTVTRQGVFRFFLAGVAAGQLRQGPVPADLKQQFAAHGIPLEDAELALLPAPASRWELRNKTTSAYDSGKHYTTRYALLEEDGRLAVYKTTYEVFCAELCGQGHYAMRAEMEVMPPAEFDAWLKAESEASVSYH